MKNQIALLVVGIIISLSISKTSTAQFYQCNPYEIVDMVLTHEQTEFDLGSSFILNIEVIYANGERATVHERRYWKILNKYKSHTRRLPPFNFKIEVEGGHVYKRCVILTDDINELPGDKTSAIVTVSLRNHPEMKKRFIVPIAFREKKSMLFFHNGKKQKGKGKNGEHIDIFVEQLYKDTIALPFTEQKVLPTPILKVMVKSRTTGETHKYQMDPRGPNLHIFCGGFDGDTGEDGGNGGNVRIFLDQALEKHSNAFYISNEGGEPGEGGKKGKDGKVEFIYKKVKVNL